MARYGKDHYHIIKTEPQDHPERLYVAHCGETSPISMHMTRGATPDSTIYCPKCSSKFFAAQLAAEPNGYTLGDKIDVPGYDARTPDGPWDKFRYARSVYPIVRTSDGQIMGVISIDTGWGKSWEVHTWTYDMGWRHFDPGGRLEGQDPLVFMSEKYATKLSWYGEGDKRKSYPNEAKGYSSKEAALSCVPQLVADGGLFAQADVLTEAKGKLAAHFVERDRAATERAQIERDREQRKLEHASEKAEAVEALREIMERSELTNFQRAGLLWAGKQLGVDLSVPAPVEAVEA